MKLKCMLLVLLGMLFIESAFTQTPKNPMGSWRISKYENRSQTIIANLKDPATYKICRSSHTSSLYFDGQVHVILEGATNVSVDLDVDSCVIVSGKRIGLGADKFPRNATHFFGTYERLENSNNWSEPSKWSYNLFKNRTDTSDLFYVTTNVEGIYRVCQKILIDETGNPVFDYEVGYTLYVDGQPVSVQPTGQNIIRYSQGNCVDVFGKDIYAQIIISEIDRNKFFKPDGLIQYILTN